MMSKRKQMTEDMKAAIRQSAAELFAEKGYPHVTMREIAKQAGCSHTAIYLYFKNKEELLQHIAIPSLLELEAQFMTEMERADVTPIDRLKAVCANFVTFCLSNGSLQTVLFITGSVRVDDPQPALEINVIRNRLFAHVRQSLQLALSADCTDAHSEEAVTNRARVLFYYLQGFVSTYTGHAEPTESLLARVLPIFQEGIAILTKGMKED
ncbi:TetR/AcrR family transcriptional regulator [Paenibacillus sacheonensis]|uniref:TetR family transcriptional regulator n=1 Tax=Paenibacillus sacheonensis TaxID=742054 RepID=A0A7X5C113_9BACL|nr:TetR/AcrR family transcriptional regulator [Paenibacillus sacheonensis]MBM7567393.1 AcrR family transcriptional regulator [Paenibacillus sacheonensis]NBC69825.1 TetR family transcriptional regulator [Paenibacillus sacheonensis]